MLTRKDMGKIASVLHRARPDMSMKGERFMWDRIAREPADTIQADNSRFKRGLFMDVIGLNNPTGWRQ